MDGLDSLLRRCTLRIGPEHEGGTGFFIAPGRVLTCAHVIESLLSERSEIEVSWENQAQQGSIVFASDASFPDLALLAVEFSNHPCVLLGTGIEVKDDLYSWGYPDKNRNGDSSLFVYEGPTNTDDVLLKMKDSQARPGLSGAPILNLRSGFVCGIIKESRDRSFPMGARAIPTETILRCLPEIPSLQAKFHRSDLKWVNRQKLLSLSPPDSSSLGIPHISGRVFSVLHEQNIHLKGRDELISTLSTGFKSTDRPQVLTQAIQGLGGVGKTQLAVEYAFRHESDYQGVWLMRAYDPQVLTADYVALGSALSLARDSNGDNPPPVALIRRLLESRNEGDGRWLLIFDNARHPSDIREYLPVRGNWDILVTSRERRWSAAAIVVDVPVLSKEASRDFLLERTGDTDLESADALGSDLGYLPLALEQAGAFISALPKMRTLREYIELFRHSSGYVLSRNDPKTGDYSATISSTWSISFDEIRRLSPAAAELLNLCSFFAPDAIPFDAIAMNASRLPEALRLSLGGIDLEAVETSHRYSLLEILDSQTVSMHTLVQLVSRNQMSRKVQRQWTNVATQIIENTFPFSVQNRESRERARRLLPHALVAIKFAETLGINRQVVASVQFLAGGGLVSVARYDDAVEILSKAIALTEKIEPSSPDLIWYFVRLGDVYQRLGHFATARDLLEKAITLAKDTDQFPDVEIADFRSILAASLRSLGDWTSAMENLRDALGILKQEYGNDGPETAHILDKMAGVMRDSGNPSAAKTYLERALEIVETNFGTKDERVALILNDLALVLRESGNFEVAKKYMERALPITEEEYGFDHPAVAVRLNNLGLVLIDLDELERAKERLERALSIDESIFGNEHPSVGVRLNNLGLVALKQKHYELAQGYFERTLAIDEKTFSPTHPEIAIDLTNLADALLKTGKPKDALPLAIRALEIREGAFGPLHPFLVSDLITLSNILFSLGDIRGATNYVYRALQIPADHEFGEYVELAPSLARLADVFWKEGNLQEAKRLFTRTLSEFERVLGRDHKNTVTVLVKLAGVNRDIGDLDEARKFYAHALSINSMTFGEESFQVAHVSNGLAGVLRLQGHFDEARQLMTNVVDLLQANDGSGNPNLATVLRNLAGVCWDQNDLLEAKVLLERALALSGGHGDSLVDSTIREDLSNLTEEIREPVAAVPRLQKWLNFLWSSSPCRAEGILLYHLGLLADRIGRPNYGLGLIAASLSVYQATGFEEDKKFALATLEELAAHYGLDAPSFARLTEQAAAAYNNDRCRRWVIGAFQESRQQA